MRRRIRILGISGAMVAAVVGVLLGSFWFAQPAVAEKAPAEVMAQGAEAVPNPKTVHIVAKVRTIGHDNFSMIGAQYDFVPVEIWKQFGETPKWRVEKPGRVAVVDGVSTTMLIRPDYVVRLPKPSRAAFDTGWLLALTNVKDMITHELRTAQAKGWKLTMSQETLAGKRKLLVTVEAKSGLPADDYLKNKFFEEADTRRVYRFDADSKRLEGFDAYLHRPDGDVLILSVERIEYDKPFDQAVFALKLPDKINVYQEPQPLADNEKYEKMTPEQAARAFFEACSRNDWAEVRKFETRDISESQKRYLGGLELVRLGKPFQSAISVLNGDWFVPYEIKLAGKQQFVATNYNPARRFVVYRTDTMPGALEREKAKKLPDNKKLEKMGPKEALEAFFDAYSRKDVAGVQKFLDGTMSDEQLKQMMDVLSFVDVQIDEPVRDEESQTWHISAKASVVKKWNLALRPYKAARRFIIDGGI